VTAIETTRHILPGLRPEPLASYLAGLGLIRLLGEQADPNATAAWTPAGLAICTSVPDLAAWLADQYVPTPIVSPWNGGSGFGVKDKEPLVRIAALRQHPSPRLDLLRDALRIADSVVAQARERGWMTEEGVKDKGKVVLELRNTCPEELLPWIDAAIVLAGRETYFPPVLGTGGNDGRLDFSTNFHQQLRVVIGVSDKDRSRSAAMARDLLGGTQSGQLGDAPIGQFDPGSAGGPGSSQFGAAGSVANPWSYVLCLEGAMLFAASAARRNQHDAGRAAMPFTVFASPDGSDSGAAGEESRGEVWAPVWTEGFTLPEVKQLFAEARASWRGHPARRAVDFYAATRTLGVARGIDEFTRFGLQRRNGLAFAAVPVDRVKVRERPAVRLAAEVEDWVARVGGSDASTSVGETLRGFRKAHLEFAREGDPKRLAAMLAALTTLEMAVGRSGRAKDAVKPRFGLPKAGKFLATLRHDESAELRIAVGLASCATWPFEGRSRSLRQILLPVDPDGWRDSPLVPGLGARPLVNVLADVLMWRSRSAPTEHDAAKYRGVTTFRSIPVPAADLHLLASGELDQQKLDVILRACLALDWRGAWPGWTAKNPDIPQTTLGLLQHLAVGLKPAAGSFSDNGDSPVPALSPDWAVRLVAGQVRQVHDEAAARLRQHGWIAGPAPRSVDDGQGTRIAAALVPRCLLPMAMLKMIAFNPNTPHEELS
jgi:CRISPR-associated protein Csx17